MYVPDEDNYIVDGENYAPPKPPEASKNKKRFSMKPFIVIGGALLIGLTVYLVSTLLFGDSNTKTKNPGVSLKLDLENTIVQNAYGMVTYGRDNNTMNKYVKEQSVRLDDFSNYEKFYYAFSTIKKDDLYDTKLTSNSKKIYGITEASITKLMNVYFGDSVTYLKQGSIPIVLPFAIDDGNFMQLVYSASDKAFTSVVEKKEIVGTNSLVPTFLTQLESATQEEDGTIQLVERIVYLSSTVANDKIVYSVYRDFNQTMPIVKNKETTSGELATKPIVMDDYLEKSNAITYTFKKSGENYYFYQSKIQE